MAQRYGGKFSPDGASGQTRPSAAPVDERVVDAAGARANLLFLPGLVVAFRALGSDPVALAGGLVAAALLTLAAWLLRDGLRAEAAYKARKVARRPALPRKMFSTALTGLGIALAAWADNGAGLITSIVYGVAASGLHLAAFGIDPLKDKQIEGIDTFQQDRVARVVEEAEANLQVMRDQIATTGDRKLMVRVDGFAATAQRMIRTVEEDPRDLTGARKFLGVYLMGARDATVKFVDLWSRNRDAEARASFEALLDDLQDNFAARTEKMLLDDRSDMDIEIKVLRDRLQREGL